MATTDFSPPAQIDTATVSLRRWTKATPNLNGMTQMEDGGHLHVDYFPDHPYLPAGSVPLVVNSPHGGMPTR